MATKSKKTESSLGKSLMKKRRKIPKNKEARFEHADFSKEDTNKLQSVVEQNPLTEFLQAAELSAQKFEAAKDVKIATTAAGNTIIIDLNSLKHRQKPENLSTDGEILKNLRIPRRPKWDESTSAALLQHLENSAFLNWRRELAKVEENYQDLHITPYEKNPEVWRQLWRVIEKSDIIVQIVDGRDPLFFRCEDVENYVKEIDSFKENVLLINKADLLSEAIRKHWNSYLVKRGINHIFFSARTEQEKINSEETNEKSFGEKNVEGELIAKKSPVEKEEAIAKKSPGEEEVSAKKSPVEEEISAKKFPGESAEITNSKKIPEEIAEIANAKKIPEEIAENATAKEIPEEIAEKATAKKTSEETAQTSPNYTNSWKIASRETLLSTLKSLAVSLKTQRKHSEIATIGMVGYPNVGKSSIINVLCGKKLVGVGARPGKTKHFQTIFIEKDVVLCDCPGLVFPSVAATKAEMVCNGVLPIDNLKDYIGPVEVLCAKVPKAVFEKLYHIKLEGNKLSASNLLSVFARNRGFFTGGSGLPDFAKVARIILKDLVNGKLLLCKLSPEYDEKTEGILNISNAIDECKEIDRKEEAKTEEIDEFFKGNDQKELDEQDFEELLKGKCVKGVKLNKIMRREIKFALKRGENLDLSQILSRGKTPQIVGKMGKYANHSQKVTRFGEEKSEKSENDEDFEEIEDESNEEDEKNDK